MFAAWHWGFLVVWLNGMTIRWKPCSIFNCLCYMHLLQSKWRHLCKSLYTFDVCRTTAPLKPQENVPRDDDSASHSLTGSVVNFDKLHSRYEALRSEVKDVSWYPKIWNNHSLLWYLTNYSVYCPRPLSLSETGGVIFLKCWPLWTWAFLLSLLLTWSCTWAVLGAD